ncbi:MAG: ribonuclease Y [bacterium]|nr:ribonuclease Y [bacterium]
MQLATILLITLSVFLLGLFAGYILRWLISISRRNSMDLAIKQTILNAKTEAQKILEEAKGRVHKLETESESSLSKRNRDLRVLEERLGTKDTLLDQRQLAVAGDVERCQEKTRELAEKEARLDDLYTTELTQLEKIAGYTKEQALDLLQQRITTECEEDVLKHINKVERAGKQKIEHQARALLASAIQRIAGTSSEPLLTNTIELPSEETKGKIIGKEGRNVRAFERATGVDLIIDDTPMAVSVSSFDPVRRHIAKTALLRLIEDGRIHPAKIEEITKAVAQEIKELMVKKGEEAAYEVGAFNLDPQLLSLVGRLYFRTSYGQNVLTHSLEMAHISAILAEELGADVQTVKVAALLHDIGKAIDHEITGTHVDIGRRLLRKYGVDENIIVAMQSHHEEYPYGSLESIIVQTADAISASRPGARRDTAPQYIKRLTDLETIAREAPGIIDSFAVQAGRELRIFVDPEKINDIDARDMARNIAKRVETEVAYPGEIKVVVIREQRTIEFAR